MVDMIIPTNDPAIPTSSFNFIQLFLYLFLFFFYCSQNNSSYMSRCQYSSIEEWRSYICAKFLATPLIKGLRSYAYEDSGVSSMELRVLEHPPQLWHNSQLSTSAQILSMI